MLQFEIYHIWRFSCALQTAFLQIILAGVSFYFHLAFTWQHVFLTQSQCCTAFTNKHSLTLEFYIRGFHDIVGKSCFFTTRIFGADIVAMDRATISQLTTTQLAHLLFVIISEICSRLGIAIDHTAVFTFQFPEELYQDLEASQYHDGS